MFRFEKYEDSLEEQWDKFITEKSINGTFLQSRRFFNYHPAGRFKDVSLVVYNEKNNICSHDSWHVNWSRMGKRYFSPTKEPPLAVSLSTRSITMPNM